MRGMILILLIIFTNSVFTQTSIDVEDSFDFQLAMNYANQNGVDTIFLSTPGGLYTTTDTLFFNVTSPMVIMAKPGITDMPTITHSDDSMSVLEIFRISNDVEFNGIIFDCGHEQSHGMKYALRGGHGPDDFPLAKEGFNITVTNCVFKDIYRNKDPQETGGHALYFLRDIKAGTVKIENCTIMNTGDEAIRMSETEKYAVTRCLDTLIVRNTTFTNTGSECIRFYADLDTATTDAYVLLENLTMDSCATEHIYIKNNQYATARNIIISNVRLPDPDRADRAEFLIQLQQKGSTIYNVDTFNVKYGPIHDEETIRTTKGGDGAYNIFNFDPLYTDRENYDWTLQPESPAYFSGVDNAHLGDLRWATNTPTVSPLNSEVIGNGTINFNPARVGLIFPTGTDVTVTAVPDSGHEFVEWGGDLTGTDNPASITVDAAKNITATFQEITVGVEDDFSVPYEFDLYQNYPNPFNPSTAINFSLGEQGNTSLILYDALGREIKTLFNKELNAGSHTYFFDGSNLASGVYYYQLLSGDFSATRKMLLLK
jgi:hypothetical protein